MAVKKRSDEPGPVIKIGEPSGPTVWESAPTALTRRHTFLQIYGDTGTGRTSLALTAPGPIALIHASEKLEGIVQRYTPDKEIQLYNFGGVFRGTQDDIAEQANEALIRMKAAWFDAMSWARTVILDTGTEAWELLRLARFGTTSPKGKVSYLYGPVNAEWKSMFKGFRYQERANFVIINQIREKYRNDKPTGRMEPAVQKDTPYMADVIVRLSKDRGTFTATIEKGWYNAHVEGLDIEDEMIDFATIMGLVTETDPEEWS
jgi:hypothetical protein